jgi:hypothetical protein
VLELENLAEFSEGIDRWIGACEDLADGAFRGLAIQAFKYVVQGTPQWTGNLAASWRFSIGSPSSGYDETVFKEVVADFPGGATASFSRLSPNPAAIHYAYALAQPAVSLMRLGAEVYITNNAPYAAMVEADKREDGRAFIRLVNLPIEMTHAAAEQFSGMGEIFSAKARSLAREKLV